MGYIGQAPANKAVKTADIEDSAITAAKIADGTVVAGELASDSVTTAKILNANVTTAKLAADAVDGTKLADDAVNSEHYTDGSIDTAHIADLNVTTAKLAADSVTAAKIGDDVINSEHYVAASIDNEHLADDAVGIAELSATGTASSSTFLRGDNSWTAAGGGSLIKLASGTQSAATTHRFNTTVLSATYDRYKFMMSDISQASSGTDNSSLIFRWVMGGTIQTATSFVHAWQSLESADGDALHTKDGDEWTAEIALGDAHRFDPDDPFCCEIDFCMNPHAGYSGNIIYFTTIGQVTGSHFSREDGFAWYNTAANKTGFDLRANDNDSFGFKYELYGYEL